MNARSSNVDHTDGGRASRLSEIGVWAATTFGMLVLLYTRLLAGEVILSRDTSRMVLPMKAFFVESIRAGELPMWYPYEGLGTPFLGSAVTAVFHPLTWLALPLGPIGGHAAATLLTLLVVSGGVWVFTRRIGGNRTAAATAVAVALGGGSVVSMLDNQTFAWGASAIPWFLYGVHRSQDEHGGAGMAWAAAAVAWALLAGDVQAVVMMAVLGLPSALLWGAPRRLRPVVRLGTAGLLGAALGAVQLLPSLSVFLGSARARGVPFAESVIWSMHPMRLPELLLGDLLQHDPVAGAQVVDLMGLGARTPWQLSVYLGPLTVFGVLMAFRSKGATRRTATLLAALATLSLLLALGRVGGLWLLFREALPLWSGFRYPEKLLAVVQLLAASLVGLGVGESLRNPRSGPRMAWVAVGLLGALAAGLYLGAHDAEGLLLDWLTRGWTGAARSAALTGLVAVVLVAYGRRLLDKASIVAGTLVLLVAVDLAAQHGRLVTIMTAPPEAAMLESPVAARILREIEPGPGAPRVTTYRERPVGVVMEGVDHPGFVGVALWDRAALLPDHNALFRIPATSYYLPGVDERVLKVIAGGVWNELLHHAPTFSSRFFVFTTEMIRSRNMRPELILEEWEGLGIALVERRDALPRLYLARPQWVESGEEAHARLGDPHVQSGEIALVEQPNREARFSGAGGEGRIEVTEYRARRVEVSVEAAQRAILVHTDAWSPDWECRLDGEPTQLLRANYAVRGIDVPAGQHRVVCEMPTPPFLWAGSGVSLAAAVLLPLSWRRRRRFLSPAAR